MICRFRNVIAVACAPMALMACDPMVMQTGATQVVYCTRAPAGYVVPQDKWDPYMVACPVALPPVRFVPASGGGGGSVIGGREGGNHQGGGTPAPAPAVAAAANAHNGVASVSYADANGAAAARASYQHTDAVTVSANGASSASTDPVNGPSVTYAGKTMSVSELRQSITAQTKP